MAITISGSGITSANILDGTIVNADINSSAAIAGSKLTGTGKVLQVVQVVKTDTFTTSSSSWVDVSGLSVTITPSSASSKILVSYDIGMSNTSATYRAYAKLVRGGTDIILGDSAGSRTRVTSFSTVYGVAAYYQSSITYLDSPATTSATTYKIQVGSFNGNTVTVNRAGDDADSAPYARMPSTITVMEIGA